MATIASRLTNTGILSISGEFDEVTLSVIKLTPNNMFTAELDEISINPISNGVAKRETVDGKLLVSGYFDEVDKPV
jgi:hypothetical protein